MEIRILSNPLFQNSLDGKHHLRPVLHGKIHGKLHPVQILPSLPAVQRQESKPVFIGNLAVPSGIQLPGLLVKIVADGLSEMAE